MSGPSSRRRRRKTVCVRSERSSLSRFNFHCRSSNRTGGPRRETSEREEAKLKDPNSRLGSCRSDARAATRQSVEAALFGFRLQSVILDQYNTVHRHLDFFFPPSSCLMILCIGKAVSSVNGFKAVLHPWSFSSGAL